MLLSETLDAGRIDFFERVMNAAAIPAMTISAAAIAIQRAPACRVDSAEFLRNLRVSNLVVVEINNANAHPMFHFAATQIVQVRFPTRIVFQVFGDTRFDSRM